MGPLLDFCMTKPSCVEIKNTYTEILHGKVKYFSAFETARAGGFKDNEKKQNALAIRIGLSKKIEEFKKMMAPFKTVPFYGEKLYRYEAVAMQEIIYSLEKELKKPFRDFIRIGGLDLHMRIPIRDKCVVGLCFDYLNLKHVPPGLKKLPNLKFLSMDSTDFSDMDSA
jgi:hypothetical protein